MTAADSIGAGAPTGVQANRRSTERRLRVSVISPSAAVFSGAATSIIAPAHDGELGILYGHAPMVVLLGEGVLHIRTDDGPHRFRVARGFLQVLDNTVAVLAEEVEPDPAG